MSELPPPDDVASEDESGERAPISVEDVELTPPAIRWFRTAVALLIAATVVALIGLGSDGRAAGVWGAFTAGLERVGDEASSLWDRTRNELQDRAATEPVPVGALAAPTGSYSAVIVVEDNSGAGASVLLAVADPDGSATLIMFPRSLTATVPGYGDFSLGDTALFEDPHLTALTLSNLLGVRVDATIGLDSASLAAAIDGPLTVELPSDVVLPSGDGSTILAERGTSALAPAVVAATLVTQGESDALSWLERQGAVWQAIFSQDDAGSFISAVAGLSGPGEDGTTVLEAVASGSPLTVGGPPLTNVGVGSDEELVLRGDDAVAFVDSRIAHLLIRSGERARVEVLNGNGRPQTTRLVAETLVRRGFRIIRTDNADSFDYPDSRVIAQGRDNRLPGAEIVDLLGVGQLELEVRAPSGVVDVSIIVGDDIPIGEGP